MAVRELRSQEAQNDAGVILRSVNRETMQLEYQGRTLDFAVDRAPNDYGVYLPPDPTWNDGTPIDQGTRTLLKDGISKFVTPMEDLLKGIEAKRAELDGKAS